MLISIDFKTKLSPADTFSFIAKNLFKNHEKWDPYIIENTKLTDGPVRVGTKGRTITNFLGKQKADFEVTEFIPDKTFIFVNTSGDVQLTRAYSFSQSKNGGTNINFSFEIKPGNLQSRLGFPIIVAIVKKRVPKNIKLLQDLLDSQK